MENFNELSLSPPILKAISELGFEKPSPIQAQTLPILLGEPTDFLGLAATGTGKTAAFAIPLLERIDESRREIQGLILCPTRELALQVAGQIELLGKHKGIRALAVYGGAGYNEQISGLRRGVHVVVGTPGRLCDHMDRGTLKLGSLETVILDEADEMISMGFKEDLEKILSGTDEDQRRIWLFSATMSPGVRKVADEYLRKPQQVQVNRTEMLSDTVEQFYYMTQESNKPEVLCKLIDAVDDFYGLIFFQTKALVVDGMAYLRDRGYKVDCLHGDMDQNARERTMQAFRDRKATILLCTDVASRGLDVKDITHVINYSIPRELDSYVHRIGRTGRAGKAGLALSLVTPSHRVLIGRIEKMTKSRMKEGRIPTRKEIGAKKIARILTTFQAQEGHTKAVELLDETWKTALASMTTEEVAGRFLSLMYPEVFNDKREESSPVRNERVHTGPGPRYGGAERRPERGAGYGRKIEAGPGYGRRVESGAGYGRKIETGPGYGRKIETGAGYGRKIETGAGYGKKPAPRGEYGAGYGKKAERPEYGAGYAKKAGIVSKPAVIAKQDEPSSPSSYYSEASEQPEQKYGAPKPSAKDRFARPKPMLTEETLNAAASDEGGEKQSWYKKKPMKAANAAPSSSPAPWSWKSKAKAGTTKPAGAAKPHASAAPRPHFKERQAAKVKTQPAK
jgi:ATP-dependent RNA helicase DeaD